MNQLFLSNYNILLVNITNRTLASRYVHTKQEIVFYKGALGEVKLYLGLGEVKLTPSNGCLSDISRNCDVCICVV